MSDNHQSRKSHDWNIPPRYEVRRSIGTGSYGHVSEAYDHVAERVVAIKKVHRVFEDLIDCKRILREIAILNRLNHEYIVKLYDICVPDDLENFDELYLVLEICDSDFKKLFRSPVHLTELHIKTLLYHLLVGVKYLHSAGIYHRDLKPANCLVNQDCTVKICDFGLSRAVDSTVRRPLSTEELEAPEESGAVLKRQLTGHVVTRWYRAPELILLDENYTEQIDVWSVGCIFAELLGMMKENVPIPADRGPLFPGSSCFPLSPDRKHAKDFKFHTRGNRDQLNMIFNVLGTPNRSDIEALEKTEAQRYIRFFTEREGSGVMSKYQGSSKEALELLNRMLVFSPEMRIGIDEALAFPLFNEIRNVEVEREAEEKVFLEFESEAELDEAKLRKYFIMEIQKFHPEVRMPWRFRD